MTIKTIRGSTIHKAVDYELQHGDRIESEKEWVALSDLQNAEYPEIVSFFFEVAKQGIEDAEIKRMKKRVGVWANQLKELLPYLRDNGEQTIRSNSGIRKVIKEMREATKE